MHARSGGSDNTKDKGDRAERWAREWLEQHGFRVVARNVRGRGGEIDVVAWQGEVLCFIEVRSRATDRLVRPAATVRHVKQRRLIQTAAMYLQQHFPHGAPPCRFDVIAIVGYGDRSRVRHVAGAFAMDVDTSGGGGNPWRPS